MGFRSVSLILFTPWMSTSKMQIRFWAWTSSTAALLENQFIVKLKLKLKVVVFFILNQQDYKSVQGWLWLCPTRYGECNHVCSGPPTCSDWGKRITALIQAARTRTARSERSLQTKRKGLTLTRRADPQRCSLWPNLAKAPSVTRLLYLLLIPVTCLRVFFYIRHLLIFLELSFNNIADCFFYHLFIIIITLNIS